MPFRIITYSNPYELDKDRYWNIINSVPHLTASTVLANGMRTVLGSKANNVMYAIDNVINDEYIYGKYTNNVPRKISQYAWLGAELEKIKNNEDLDDKLYKGIIHNKRSLLDALNLFVELGVSANAFRKTNASGENIVSKEQEIFIDLLKKIYDENVGHFVIQNEYKCAAITPEVKGSYKHENSVSACLKRLVKKDYDDINKELESNPRDERFNAQKQDCLRWMKGLKDWDGQTIVVHGLNQFSPMQLRFIMHLDKLGVEVIFLFNYQEEFKNIYKTWTNIYDYFQIDYEIDEEKYQLPFGSLIEPGYCLGKALGDVVEKGIIPSDFSKLKLTNFYMFDNVTTFANYASDCVKKAKEKIRRAKQTTGTKQLLKSMDKLFYTANSDVSDLLDVYYPEYSQERHFLAYPIGQFFTALYGLWDGNEIKIDLSLLKECFNAGILEDDNKRLLQTAILLEDMFDGLETYSEFQERFMLYKNKYLEFTDDLTAVQKTLAIYNVEEITIQDIECLINAVKHVNEIGKIIFNNDGSNKYNFSEHFAKVLKLVKEKKDALADGEEKKLVVNLIERLNNVLNFSNDIEGNLKDLREGLYYYLKGQKTEDTYWIVKNFEQIEGDVLISLSQIKNPKTYHFGCVSDLDMNQTVDKLLPWPITENFVNRSCSPVDLEFKLYYASLCERNNFLRYVLFYGLFYNRGKVEIGFVKNENDRETELYSLFRIMGIECKKPDSDKLINDVPLYPEEEVVPAVLPTYNDEELAAIAMCPCRFIYDFVLKKKPLVYGGIQSKRFMENLLLTNFFEEYGGEDIDYDNKIDSLNDYINDFIEQCDGFAIEVLPYYTTNAEFDSKCFVRSYLQNMAENPIHQKYIFAESGFHHVKIKNIDSDYHKIRRLYGCAKWIEDSERFNLNHPCTKINEYMENGTNEPDKYALSIAHLSNKQEIKRDLSCFIEGYINNRQDKEIPVKGSWCQYCGGKDICLSSFFE